MKKSSLGRFFAYLALGVITIGVMLFLGKHSLNFFTLSFTGDDVLYAWLGLLLTSGGVVVWLTIFTYLAKTTIQRGVTLAMMVVAAIGEFVTAGFDMYMNTMKLADNFQFAPAEIRLMSTAVAFLGLLTGFAIIAYTAGDMIAEAFGDEDNDGTPNYRDSDYKKNRQQPQPLQPMRVNASEAELVALREENAKLKANASLPNSNGGTENH